MSEWFKELVLKTSDSERGRGFESHLLRSIHFMESDIDYGEVPKLAEGAPLERKYVVNAAQGFKSLLLRLSDLKKFKKIKKCLTRTASYDNIYKLSLEQQSKEP